MPQFTDGEILRDLKRLDVKLVALQRDVARITRLLALTAMLAILAVVGFIRMLWEMYS